MDLICLAGVLGMQDLVVLATEVAAELGMQLPPVNAGAMLHRFVAELVLAQVRTSVHLRSTVYSSLVKAMCWATSQAVRSLAK